MSFLRKSRKYVPKVFKCTFILSTFTLKNFYPVMIIKIMGKETNEQGGFAEPLLVIRLPMIGDKLVIFMI